MISFVEFTRNIWVKLFKFSELYVACLDPRHFCEILQEGNMDNDYLAVRQDIIKFSSFNNLTSELFFLSRLVLTELLRLCWFYYYYYGVCKISPRSSLDKSIGFLVWIIYSYYGPVDSWVEVYGNDCRLKV